MDSSRKIIASGVIAFHFQQNGISCWKLPCPLNSVMVNNLKNLSNPDNIYDDTIYVVSNHEVKPMLPFTFMMNLNHISGYVCYSNAELK